AVAPDAIARHVGADIEIGAERGDYGIADIGHADDRAGFRIELAEAMKGGSEFFRQDRQIALDIAVGNAGRGRRHTVAAIEAGLMAWPDRRFAETALLFPGQTDIHLMHSVPRQVPSIDSTMPFRQKPTQFRKAE